MRPDYNEGVRRILSHAQTASARDNHRFVHTEYLLLGLLQEPNSATRVLKELGFDRNRLIQSCQARCKRGQHGKDTHLKLTTRTQQALILAEHEAAEYGDGKVRTPHILLGLLLEAEGKAGQVLREAGLTAGAVRTALAGKTEDARQPEPEPVRHRPDPPKPDARKPLWKLLLRD